MSEENKAIARYAYELFNAQNLDALEEVLATNVVDHSPAPGQPPGIEGVKQFFGMLFAAFPDFYMTVEDMIAEGDKVVARVRINSTHQGEFMGIPPTGIQVTQTGIDILRIANGKVVERWGEFDNMGLMQQLGVIPS